jgi:hypothetical protein
MTTPFHREVKRHEGSELNRRLAMLKTEVELDYKGLLARLEEGMKMVFVTETPIGLDLDPDALRRIGGMVLLCNHYKCGVLFVCGIDCAEMSLKRSSDS